MKGEAMQGLSVYDAVTRAVNGRLRLLAAHLAAYARLLRTCSERR